MSPKIRGQVHEEHFVHLQPLQADQRYFSPALIRRGHKEFLAVRRQTKKVQRREKAN